MTHDKYICRGITKEGKFVYGYPMYNLDDKYWYIISQSLKKKGDLVVIDCGVERKHNTDIVEIIQEPDRWTELEDKNGKKIWENDKVKGKVRNYGSPEKERILEVKYSDYKGAYNIYDYSYSEIEKVEIIGNTHGISTKEGK